MKKETSVVYNNIILKYAHRGNNTAISIITVYNNKYRTADFAEKDRELMLLIAENTVRKCISDNHTFYLKGGKKIKAINLQAGDKLQKCIS